VNTRATAHRTGQRGHIYRPLTGTAFLHTVIDDHSGVAHIEIWTDEKAQTAIGVLRRAVAWFAEHCVIVERVLSENGSCYCSYAWFDACAALCITHKSNAALPPPDQRLGRTLSPRLV
jgi:hypothetical protein